jgi:hypothetical protein
LTARRPPALYDAQRERSIFLALSAAVLERASHSTAA